MNLILGIVILICALSIYFLPFTTAANRFHPHTASIFILNLFLGWTFFGWVLALVWAFASPRPAR